MKRYHRYQMDFDHKACWMSGICMGLPVFMLSIYYLFFQEINAVPVFNQIVNLWLPIVLSLGYIAMLRVVRWNSVGMFAILGAAVCLMLILQLFLTANVLRIILGILGYLIAGGLLVLCAGGYLPGRMIVSLVFLLILLMRLLFFRNFAGWAWLQDISAMSYIAAFALLPVGYQDC